MSNTSNLHIIFDGPPGPIAGRFVECETPDGRSLDAGNWSERPDGLWQLVISCFAGTAEAPRATSITLEQSLRDLMDAHNLSSISIGLIRGADGVAFPNCYVQGDGFCGSAVHRLPLADEVAAAIAELNAKRGATPIVELPALVIGEAA